MSNPQSSPRESAVKLLWTHHLHEQDPSTLRFVSQVYMRGITNTSAVTYGPNGHLPERALQEVHACTADGDDHDSRDGDDHDSHDGDDHGSIDVPDVANSVLSLSTTGLFHFFYILYSSRIENRPRYCSH